MILQGAYYAGTSGLVLPVPNKLFYPPQFQDKPRLSYYASLFNSIEINSSFYKVPMATTVHKWAQSVPDSFRFTFKIWQQITHQSSLEFNPDDVVHFIKVINEAGNKKGCLLVQFPPGVKANNISRFERLLNCIRKTDEENNWKVAVEFRHKSWYNQSTYNIIQQYNMAMVIHDLPASASPLEPATDSAIVYLRFHGPNGGYRGSYTNDFLSEYAGYINDWQTAGKTVYTYFNNTMGDAVKNLITLNQFINSKL